MQEKINRFFEFIIILAINMFIVGYVFVAVMIISYLMTCLVGYHNLVDDIMLRSWFRYVWGGYLMFFLSNILVLLVFGLPWYVFTCDASDGMCLVKTKTTKKTIIK